MTKIRQMTYQPTDGSTAPVEMMTFDALRAANNGGTQRADFVVVAVVVAGHGSVDIDFATHVLSTRSVVWIAPGAVHRWTDIADLRGELVLFTPTAPVTFATRERAASFDIDPVWTASRESWPFITTAVDHLRVEASAQTQGAAVEIPAMLLSALIARFAPPTPSNTMSDAVYSLFRDSVEQNFRAHHDVGFYARRLGYAARTLSRACVRATGLTAKAIITERVMLEAKRLLAHDRLTAAQCTAVLGFADPSVFSAFFVRESGVRPGRWRARTLSVSALPRSQARHD
ncbi:AraC family transcriptional regulator [Paramicrobacterium chengjingii]|uniref:Helix-turn-helix domain-containing protein n=1 Tax=Paramicrobacterium chengjingii TaxID=2769067 RepID=A0ABX6YLM5_9MICO|nr:helix-turn-helix domain-containing protein [Microbacterium chengjingii]QPZ39565.1 helix-turn-helix domain-containing protein [Microbacterium chengjingii]